MLFITNHSDRDLLEIIAQQGQQTYLRLEKLEHKVDRIDQRLEKLEHKVDKIDQRLEKLEHKVDKLEQRQDVFEQKLEIIIQKVQENHEILITVVDDFKTFKEIINEHEFSIRLLNRKLGS